MLEKAKNVRNAKNSTVSQQLKFQEKHKNIHGHKSLLQIYEGFDEHKRTLWSAPTSLDVQTPFQTTDDELKICVPTWVLDLISF